MKKSIFIVSRDLDIQRIIYSYQDLIKKLIFKFGEVTLVSFDNFFNNRENIIFSDKKIDNFNNKLSIFFPKNKNEFNNICKSKKIIAIDNLGKNFKDFILRRLIKKNNIKLALILNQGFISNDESYPINELSSLIFEIKKKIFVTFYRILVLLKYIPNIHFYFDTRKDICENCLIKKKNFLSKLFFFLNINYFENIYHINSLAYDNFIIQNNTPKEEKIVFIDNNYNHRDITSRHKFDRLELRRIYFSRLKFFFEWISSLCNKNIEICLHPTSDFDDYKSYFNHFEISQYQTQHSILNAYIVLFHFSGSVSDAVLNKKKIISLKTGLLGSYVNYRINRYTELLKTISINIDDDQYLLLSPDLIKKELNNYDNNYESYINNFLKNKSEYQTGADKIVEVFNQQIF